MACDADKDSSPPAAETASAQLPAIRVKVATATRGELSIDGRATGQLHAFKSATIAAEAPGRVLRRDIERGQAVVFGDPMFRVDASKARLQYRQAVANEQATSIDLDLAQRELGRGDQLVAAEDISRSQHDKLAHTRDSAAQRRELAKINRRLARRAMADANVRAPFGGRVVSVHAEVGDYVGPGAPLATIVDLSRLRLRVGLTASEAYEIAQTPGREVQVRFDELGGTEVPAVLHDVSPLADPRSGTYTAEFWLGQPKGQPLRQGMVGRLDLRALAKDPAVLVPRQAVTRHEGAFSVWVLAEEEGAAVVHRRRVELGRHDREHTEVRVGLETGERVVVEGMFALAEGDRVELDGGEG